MVMSENYKVQAKVYDRMEELEANIRKPREITEADFYSFALAKIEEGKKRAELAEAKTAEVSAKLEVAETKIILDAPKVEIVEQIEASVNSISIDNLCKNFKHFDIGRTRMFALLRHSGFLNEDNSPRQTFLNTIFETESKTYEKN